MANGRFLNLYICLYENPSSQRKLITYFNYNHMSTIFTSSIGKKLLMSLAGIFLLTFLVVHLGINLLVILYDDPMVFNRAAHFMGTNKIIKVMEIILFGGFLLHIIYALILQVRT